MFGESRGFGNRGHTRCIDQNWSYSIIMFIEVDDYCHGCRGLSMHFGSLRENLGRKPHGNPSCGSRTRQISKRSDRCDFAICRRADDIGGRRRSSAGTHLLTQNQPKFGTYQPRSLFGLVSGIHSAVARDFAGLAPGSYQTLGGYWPDFAVSGLEVRTTRETAVPHLVPVGVDISLPFRALHGRVSL